MYNIVLRDHDGVGIVSTYLTNEEAQNQLDELVEIHNRYSDCCDKYMYDFIVDKFSVYLSDIPELTIEISESLDFKIDKNKFEEFKKDKILKDIHYEMENFSTKEGFSTNVLKSCISNAEKGLKDVINSVEGGIDV